MSKFKFVKQVNLQPFGAAAGSYLEFSPITFNEGEQMGAIKPTNPEASEDEQALNLAKQILALLKDHFIAGQIDSVEVTADDLAELTPEIIYEARKLVIPEPPSPNSSTPSTS